MNPAQPQSKGFKYVMTGLLVVLLLVAVLIASVFGIIWFTGKQLTGSMKSLTSSEPPTREEKANLILDNLSMSYGASDKGNFIASFGTIKNLSSDPWERPQIEARYYDENGKMIDTVTEVLFQVTIPPKSEVAFRLRDSAHVPQEKYVSQKVTLVWAKKATGLF